MHIKNVLAATLSGLAGVALVGSTSGCGLLTACPEDEPFTIDQELRAEHVTDRLAGESGTDTGGEPTAYASVDEIPCESFCEEFVTLGREDVPSISSCSFDVSGYIEGTDPTEVVGSVQCSGHVIPRCIGGRRPLGHVERALDGADALGRMFAGSAHLEAASIVAFEQLASQLERWGAPAQLSERCRDAAADERRHTQVMTGFATARGATVAAPQQIDASDDLLCAAIHNATEGCVSETWAALLAHHQAARAHESSVRSAFTEIARDETRHAQLAWDLHEWFLSQLAPAQQSLVLEAHARAIAELPGQAQAQAQAAPPAFGVPAPALAVSLAEDFGARLLAA